MRHSIFTLVLQHGIRLVGIDNLSIGDLESGEEVHRILLESNVAILEGLNLSQAPTGQFELICFPLNIIGAEGAPARAILRPTG